MTTLQPETHELKTEIGSGDVSVDKSMAPVTVAGGMLDIAGVGGLMATNANTDTTHAHSLEKLLTHIESLKKSNHEMNAALNSIIDGNKDKLKSMLSSKIEPWIKSLQIPEEHQKAFLNGIEAACQQGQYKGMIDFEKNPAFTVACAAAAAHGQATQAAEDTRLKLQTFMNETDVMKSKEIQQVKDRHSNEQRMLFVAAAGSEVLDAGKGESVLGKRGAPETNYQDADMENSKCWETVFTTIRQ